jgi:hypothetical protein
MQYPCSATKKQSAFPPCVDKMDDKYTMNTTLNERLIAYLALLSGLALSSVAIYYSVAGLTAIFSAAVIPIIIMGVALEVSKIVATVWLKQNWSIAPLTVKTYLCIAIAMLMVITSMGIFGFLSKAHSDQNLVSGDVAAKIAVYDEKINIAKENIDANRKTLKQLDEAVDQVMGRSNDQKGAEKSVNIRRSQQKERARLQEEIQTLQISISQLNEERAPIAAEVRKVEAEVGPIKYIAAFVYGSTDETILERAVTWVIILIIVVFDPLALILLIASQISFEMFRSRDNESIESDIPIETTDVVDTEPLTATEHEDGVEEEPEYEEDDGALSSEQIEQIKATSTVMYGESTPEEDEVFNNMTALNASGYVQNEEQSTSNVWSKVNSISRDDYVKTSKAKIEQHVNELAERVKNNELSIDDVPRYIKQEVSAKL